MSLKNVLGPGQMYRIMRHFLWAVPLANLLLFLAAGLIAAAAVALAQIVAVARVPHAPDRCDPAALARGRAADLFLGLAAPGGWYCGAGDAPP